MLIVIQAWMRKDRLIAATANFCTIVMPLGKWSFLILYLIIDSTLGGNDQRRLLKYLLSEKQYDPLERPALNDSESIPVSINLSLQQIVDYDGKNEVITLSGWMVLTWKDYGLTWDPDEFGNIRSLRLPSTQIWTPDILLYSSADDKFDSTIKVNAVVQHTGDILYVPPGIFKSICPFNIATFPFDTQNCVLKFGSWTFDDMGINLTADGTRGQLDAYMKSAEWDLEDFSASSHTLKYDCCPTLYPYVLFTIRIRRRPLYYFTNIVVPCFLISCLTILGFLLAPDSGEKLTLQITILLSVVMFSLVMSEILPPSSHAVPIISMYFLCVMFMSTLSVVASVLVISLHFRNAKNYQMPAWVRKYICHYLASLLWMSRPNQDLTWRGVRRKMSKTSKTIDRPKKPDEETNSKSPTVPLLNNILHHVTVNEQTKDEYSRRNRLHRRSVDYLVNTSESNMLQIQRSNACSDLTNISHSTSLELIRSDLRIIIGQLSILTQNSRQQAKFDDESQDWKFVAMVIDRLCLLIFTTSMIAFTGYTFYETPNIFKLR